MSDTTKSKINALLKTIREDARANNISAETILLFYQVGRYAFQLAGKVPNEGFLLYHANPDAPEHAD